jgi:hypothetical protein
VALTWHHTRERLTVACHGGALQVHCLVCDSSMEVRGEIDVNDARQFCTSHRSCTTAR